MNIVYKNDLFAIIDNVFDSEQYEQLWVFMQDENYRYNNGDSWHKGYSVLDGRSLKSTFYNSKKINKEESSTFPTNRAIDLLFEYINNNLEQLSPWIDEGWSHYTILPSLYYAGSSLSWHDDYKKISGSIIFYVHPTWNSNWGGELLIADGAKIGAPLPEVKRYNQQVPTPLPPHLDNSRYDKNIMQPGFGRYIASIPNRLIVMRPGVPHKINRVDIAAGNNVRAALLATFINPDKPDRN